MHSFLHYAALSPADAAELGVAWSYAGDALDTPAGTTSLFAAQVAGFLDGFGSVRPVVHVRHVVTLMQVLYRVDDRPGPLQPLRDAVHAVRRLRNAGVLCGHLCRHVPAVADPPDAGELARWLAGGPDRGRLHGATPGERPALSDGQFLDLVRQELERYTPEDLRHWLTHAAGPDRDAGQAAERVAEAVRPSSLAELLADLARQRPRLGGAVPLVEQLVAALTLPPRRPADEQLPVGGYADVTTRGGPDQLLPSQLVLDPDEFVRRFAGGELLFFRREPPHRRTPEELVLLLDQGVRTWGRVRLALMAAVTALARRAGRRSAAVRVATTGVPAAADPLALAPDALADRLEASDFTAHPADALRAVLADPAAAAGDVVLLTHPRALAEPAVLDAAAALTPTQRLFAVAVDEHGSLAVSEVRRGGVVRLSGCRIDLSRAQQPTAVAKPKSAAARAGWAGDAEAVPWPFRFGPTRPLAAVGFDLAGEWFVGVTAGGVVHAWPLDGSPGEVLPRAVHRGYGLALPKQPHVVPVAGGFVLAGEVGDRLAAAHYDFAARRVTAYDLGACRGHPEAWKWFSFADLNCVAARRSVVGSAVDLATGGVWPGESAGLVSRARAAWDRAGKAGLPPPDVFVVKTPEPQPDDPSPNLRLSVAGTFTLRGTDPAWPPFTPLADGKPAFDRVTVVKARFAGLTLAVVHDTAHGRLALSLFRGPEAVRVGYHELPNARPDALRFALSPDGRLIMRELDGVASVFPVAGGPPVLEVPPGQCQADVRVEMGLTWLTLTSGPWSRGFSWADGPLRHALGTPAAVRRSLNVPSGAVAGPRTVPDAGAYDRARFVAGLDDRRTGRRLLVDALGQVAVLDADGAVAAMLTAHRESWAAWLPDGTRCGTPDLAGGPPTPGAEEAVARALRRVTGPRPVVDASASV